MNDDASIIQLVEYESRFLLPPELTEVEAHRIYSKFDDKVAVEWPTPKTGNRWKLTSSGWVGFVPLGEGRGISLLPKVPLGNLFRMLEYAYDLRSFKPLEGLYDCESIRDFYERLAKILALRLLDRAREGLYKTYREEYAALSFVRGRIDILDFARTPVKTTVPCSFEDHAIDVEDNQIIAWTFHTILRSGICTERSIPILRKAERVLRNSVDLKPFCAFDCIDRNYNRLNADYEILHKLCRFFLENTGPTQNLGDCSMVPFLVDMASLFELFVARWIEQHLDIRCLLKSQESFPIGEKGALKMVMDLVLYDRETLRPLCVLDTKYKAHSTVSNDDYYQVVAYADAIDCEIAILIYPKELEYPFDEKPGRIRVKTAVFDIGSDLDQSGNKLLERLYAVLQTEKETVL
jgi:5-methylcytosine-specific restriction enzyme subunit McrC